MSEVEVIKRGAPSKYTQKLADELCGHLSEGLSLRTIGKMDSMPSPATVFNWLRTNDNFLEQYMRAKKEGADALADDIIEIADGVLHGKYEPRAAHVAIEGKKWVAAKLKPHVYGDKIAVDNKITVVQPILGGVAKKQVEDGTSNET